MANQLRHVLLGVIAIPLALLAWPFLAVGIVVMLAWEFLRVCGEGLESIVRAIGRRFAR